ncbi:MAG: DUF4198 domain-containing protein [Oceanicaulis sp.]
MRTLGLAVLAASVFAGAATAHEAYVLAEPGGAYLVAWGHPGEAPGRYDVDEVLDVALHGADGRALDARRLEADGQVRIEPATRAEAAMASFVFEPGATIQTGEGRYVPGSKADHPGYLRAFHSVRSGKALYAWSPAFAEPLGAELELVPLSDPFGAAQDLDLVLLYDGDPLAGAPVTVRQDLEERELTTGPDGRISVSLAQRGETLIAARHALPLDNEIVDERALSTVLTIAR